MHYKEKLRAEMKQKLKQVTSLQKEIESESICKEIINSYEYDNAKTVLVYSSLKSEVNLSSLISDAYSKDKKVAFPRINKKSMDFLLIRKDEQLVKNSYGILEPNLSASIYLPRKSDSAIIIIPGLAFTKEGKRLGRGGGYYDKYLSTWKKNLYLLPAYFKIQLLIDLPTESHDILIKQ